MATLKDHQQAMVDLLASGSGIPASASRLAHAMHDVLSYLNLEEEIHRAPFKLPDWASKQKPVVMTATEILRREAEQRVKELENTVKQLRAQREKDKNTIRALTDSRDYWAKMACREPEQAGCRKDDTQVCEHDYQQDYRGSPNATCTICGAKDELV